MKMRFVMGFWVVVWMLCSSACSYINGFDSARQVADRFFEDRFENGGVGRDEYYSKVFWDNTDHARWQNIKKLVNLSLGELQSYSLLSWNLQDQLPTSQLTGTFAVLVFETEYEKGSGLEKITLLRQDGWDKFEIVGHQIDSEQINEMILKGIQVVADQT